MGKFGLLLDESGDFLKDSLGKEVPSVVGGVLFSVDKLDEKQIGEIFVGLCNKHEIDPGKFHSTELRKEVFSSFSIDLLETLKGRGAELIMFENLERMSIVDGATTYLNILSEGLIQLFQTLAAENETLEIEITAALRMAPIEEGSKYLRQIEPAEYKTRLQEKLTIGLARKNLSHASKDWRWRITLGSARRDNPLKAADAICHTYFRKDRKFTGDQQDTLQELFSPYYLYSVFEHETAVSIKRHLSDGMAGLALFEWAVSDRYTTYAKRNEVYESEFLELILKRLAKLPSYALKAQLLIFSTYIQNLNHVDRNFKHAQETLLKVTNVLIPRMKSGKIHASQFFLETYLSLFTTATHQGYMNLADQQVNRIKEELENSGQSWENVNFIIDFMIREAIHDLNQFDYDQVLHNMDKLEGFLGEVLSILPLAGDINYFEKEMRSELKGKILGTKLQASFMAARKDRDFYLKAREDSNQAIKEFTDSHDLRRQFQYRAQIECDSGNFKESYFWLSRSFSLRGEAPFETLLASIETEPKADFMFGIMHYVRLMAQATLSKDSSYGDPMFRALIKRGIDKHEFLLSDESFHPKQIINWKIGTYLACSKSFNAAKPYYQKAIMICNSDKNRLTIRSIGLGIAFEYASLLLTGGAKEEKEAKSAVRNAENMYRNWMNEQMPQAMRDYFEAWSAELANIDKLVNEEKSKLLFNLSQKIPY